MFSRRLWIRDYPSGPTTNCASVMRGGLATYPPESYLQGDFLFSITEVARALTTAADLPVRAQKHQPVARCRVESAQQLQMRHPHL